MSGAAVPCPLPSRCGQTAASGSGCSPRAKSTARLPGNLTLASCALPPESVGALHGLGAWAVAHNVRHKHVHLCGSVVSLALLNLAGFAGIFIQVDHHSAAALQLLIQLLAGLAGHHPLAFFEQPGAGLGYGVDAVVGHAGEDRKSTR